MIKWVHVAVLARTEQDFHLLTKLLAALGFDPKDLEEYSQYRLQTFLPSVSALEVIHRKEGGPRPDLELTLSDPDSAIQVVQQFGLKVLDDSSGPEPSHAVRNFRVQLPGGTMIAFMGLRSNASEVKASLGVHGELGARGKKFAVVVSRFNSFITERLLGGSLDALFMCGIKENPEIIRVPGSFEIPSAARTLAQTGKYDAIICLGCLLRGDTAHYDVIVHEVTRGIGQSAQETGIPHAFGVLTCDTLEQAIDRAGLKMGNKGFEAALAAVEMANLKKAIVAEVSAARSPRRARSHPPGNSPKQSAKSKSDKQPAARGRRGKAQRRRGR